MIYCIVLSLSSLSAQTPVIDSLVKLLKTAKEDTNKVILLNKLAWEHLANGTQKSLEYSKAGEELAESLNYESGILKARGERANAFCMLGKFKEAEELNLELIERYKKNGDVWALGRTFNCISIVYDQQGESEKSLNYLLEALKIFEKHKHPTINWPKLINLNIGSNYIRRRNFEKCIVYLKKAETFMTDQKDGYDGSIYTSLATAYTALGKYKEAAPYYDHAEKVFTSIAYTNGLASLYGNMAVFYLQTDEYKKARSNGRKALEIFGSNYMPSELISIMTNIATGYFNDWYKMKGEKIPMLLDSAYYFQDSALRMSKRLNLKALEMECYKYISNIFKAQKKFEASLENTSHYLVLHDSLMSIDKEARINEIHTKYNVEKTENENARLAEHTKNQELIILILIILFITIIAFSILLFRQNKLKTTQRQIQLEQKLLRSQMNPHFIFNALIAIESFIYKNEAKSAGKYLSTFAKLMRMILENSREDYITLEKDIQTLKYYLELQKLRFNNKFDYNFDLTENIDPENTMIAPMLIQPFIENAIEHGLSNSDEHGKIIISFKKENDNLVIEVKDNGPGFSASANSTKTHYSMATTIVKERLANLSHKKRNFALELNDIKENNTVVGAMVRFTIPYVSYV